MYALAVLAALLTVGSLSDHVGRRPVLLVAIAVQAAAMLIFATAGDVRALLAARIVQGLATGAAVGALGAVWALAGFYGSLGPALVRLLAGSGSPVLGGLALFVLAASGGVAVLVLRSAQPPTLLLIGNLALLAGVAITLLAIADSAAGVFFAGTAIAGVGSGGGFQGTIRTVLPLAAPHERAGVLSIVYVLSYLALGLPAVIAGVLAVHGGVLATAREYGAAVMAASALALAGLARRRVRGD